MRFSMIIFLFMALYFQSAFAVSPFVDPREIESSRDCILSLIMKRMGHSIDARWPLPRIRAQSETPLSEFQDAMEVVWKYRAPVFINAFQPYRNEIFILNERAFYGNYQRSVYDSLAHELTHYIQFAYEKADFVTENDQLEWQAVEIQNWFRQEFRFQLQGDRFVCPQSFELTPFANGQNL